MSDIYGCGEKPKEMTTTAPMQAGPLMVRHIIDGHEVLLPADAVLLPSLKAACFYCGNPDAPHDTVDGAMCSDCLSMCVDM